MAAHILDPRVVAGMVIISSGDDHVTISGSESATAVPWTLEFGVRDGKIYVHQDTGEHVSAYGLLASVEPYL